jgi:hypothetical protein
VHNLLALRRRFVGLLRRRHVDGQLFEGGRGVDRPGRRWVGHQ